MGNLWKGFFGAAAALVCFQLLADFEIFYVPETRFVWLPHVGWEYYFFVAVGVLQGLFSALLVRMIAGTSRWLTLTLSLTLTLALALTVTLTLTLT